MPMDRSLYPDNWEAIARAVKVEADWRCRHCGKQCRRPGEQHISQKYTLTVAHLDHDPANCERDNLQAMCAPCHLRYDASMHARRATRTRLKRQEEAGQESLFEEARTEAKTGGDDVD